MVPKLWTDILPTSRSRIDFNSLPAELRLKIYSVTWEPRRVVVEQRDAHDDSNALESLQIIIRSAPPVTLHLNHEARHMTLRHYVSCVKTENSVLYINPTIDTVVLPFFPAMIGHTRIPDPLRNVRSLLSEARHVHSGTIEGWTHLRRAIEAGAFPNVEYIDFCEYYDELDRLPQPGAYVRWYRACCRASCPHRYAPGYAVKRENPGRSFAVDRRLAKGIPFPFRRCDELMGGPRCGEMWKGWREFSRGSPDIQDVEAQVMMNHRPLRHVSDVFP